MPTTLTAYTFDELTPKAKERALKGLPDADCDYTLQECVDSLRALCKLAGVKLVDWSLSPYDRSFVRVEIGDSYRGDGPEGLTGPRALAWIENNIMEPLRAGWYPMRAYRRKYTKPGQVPACPLTGTSFDEDLLDAFRDRDMKITLRERFESLAGIIQRICESELEAHFDGALFDEHGNKLRS